MPLRLWVGHAPVSRAGLLPPSGPLGKNRTRPHAPWNARRPGLPAPPVPAAILPGSGDADARQCPQMKANGLGSSLHLRGAPPGRPWRAASVRRPPSHSRSFADMCVQLRSPLALSPAARRTGCPPRNRRSASPIASSPSSCPGPRRGRAAAAPGPHAPNRRQTAAAPAGANAGRTPCTNSAAPKSCRPGAAEGRTLCTVGAVHIRPPPSRRPPGAWSRVRRCDVRCREPGRRGSSSGSARPHAPEPPASGERSSASACSPSVARRGRSPCTRGAAGRPRRAKRHGAARPRGRMLRSPAAHAASYRQRQGRP